MLICLKIAPVVMCCTGCGFLLVVVGENAFASVCSLLALVLLCVAWFGLCMFACVQVSFRVYLYYSKLLHKARVLQHLEYELCVVCY